MTALLPLILLFATALFAGGIVLSLVIAFRAWRERRITIFPMVAESESLRMKRALFGASIFLVLSALSIGGWAASLRSPQNPLRAEKPAPAAALPSDTPAPTATAILSTPAPAPTDTPFPTAVIVGSSTIITPEPTAAPTTAPTPPPPSAVANTNAAIPAPAAAPLPAGLSVGPISFAINVSDRREPIDPAQRFDSVPARIYAVFPYQGMKNDLPFSVIWYYQNAELIRDEYVWEWGSTDRSFSFISPVGPGAYRVEIRVNNTPVAENSFEIVQ